MSSAITAAGTLPSSRNAEDSAMSTTRLMTLLMPRRGTSLMLMIGRPSRSSIRDHAAEVADTDNEHALQADARAPAATQDVADELARRVREDDVEDEEQGPHRTRNFQVALGFERRAQLIRVDVQRAEHAENH